MNIYDPLNLIFVGFIKSRFATSEFSPKNVTLDFFQLLLIWMEKIWLRAQEYKTYGSFL